MCKMLCQCPHGVCIIEGFGRLTLVISSVILGAAKQIRLKGARSIMMNVMNTNVNTAASRQARFSFAGFFGYAYFYFFGMDNREPDRTIAVC